MIRGVRERLRVGYPSRRVSAVAIVATVIHHLVKRERKVRTEDTLTDAPPRVWRVGSVIPHDLR